jgi:hypothetical protein
MEEDMPIMVNQNHPPALQRQHTQEHAFMHELSSVNIWVQEIKQKEAIRTHKQESKKKKGKKKKVKKKPTEEEQSPYSVVSINLDYYIATLH